MNLLAPGVVAGALTLAAGIANAAGYPAVGLFLSDPATATAATSVAVGLGALVAGALVGASTRPPDPSPSRRREGNPRAAENAGAPLPWGHHA